MDVLSAVVERELEVNDASRIEMLLEAFGYTTILKQWGWRGMDITV